MASPLVWRDPRCGARERPRNQLVSAAGHSRCSVTTVAALERVVPIVVRATGTFVADESSYIAPKSRSILNAGQRRRPREHRQLCPSRLPGRAFALAQAEARAAAEAQAQNLIGLNAARTVWKRHLPRANTTFPPTVSPRGCRRQVGRRLMSQKGVEYSITRPIRRPPQRASHRCRRILTPAPRLRFVRITDQAGIQFPETDAARRRRRPLPRGCRYRACSSMASFRPHGAVDPSSRAMTL